ncbi:hypothetical protein VO63_31320 [Streptomyces showdoensis]|uniref:Uncharacterized protein n=1 Tax=Streptomyces showdoensis TaxID=68268 RepID=A0A2P2GGQ6_STREW|nr:hypothetical protein VO63_31320 [Streptomyces showdoensis]
MSWFRVSDQAGSGNDQTLTAPSPQARDQTRPWAAGSRRPTGDPADEREFQSSVSHKAAGALDTGGELDFSAEARPELRVVRLGRVDDLDRDPQTGGVEAGEHRAHAP